MPSDRVKQGFVRHVALLAVAGFTLVGASARAAEAPQLKAGWASDVAAKSARLHAELTLDPTNLTRYHFNYITQAEYEANLSKGQEGFSGAKTLPPSDAVISSGPAEATVLQLLSNLAPETTYRWRIVAKNTSGTGPDPGRTFNTQALGGVFSLSDERGWEMVSPVDKNGGQIDGPEENAGGGVLQVAADGNSTTYSSSASFGDGAAGAPVAGQYISRRHAGGWSTDNITVPLFSGSYDTESSGVPYQIFSADLSRGLLLNGRRCRSGGEDCSVANPPLPGSGAPAGYQNYYLRENASGGFDALLTSGDVSATALGPEKFELSLAGATPDLAHVVLSTCAKLSVDAGEVPLGEGCDPSKPNLYLWSGSGLVLLNLLPAQTQGTPGAELAAQNGAISADGSRVYWTDLASGNLYLRAGGQTRQVDAAAAGGGKFETASADGSLAYFTKAGHLWRYDATSNTATDLTPAGGVQGVLGASVDGSWLYYLSVAGLFVRHGATTAEVAPAADPSDYPPTVGTARVSADGTRLAFLSRVSLTGYDNTGPGGTALSEVFLYDAVSDHLTCVSCNPTNARPLGPSTIPGAIANGSTPGSMRAYKPRVLSADGRRLFFDSGDPLVPFDTSASSDVYQWEAQGEGSCTRPAGCVNLISSGKAEQGSTFVDASADGSDAFFRTDQSLVGEDPGSIDLYDARVGGGFPVEPPPIPCEGDACQSLPPEPVDPVLNTLVTGSGNPPVHFHDTNRRRPSYHRLRGHHHGTGKHGHDRGKNRGRR